MYGAMHIENDQDRIQYVSDRIISDLSGVAGPREVLVFGKDWYIITDIAFRSPFLGHHSEMPLRKFLSSYNPPSGNLTLIPWSSQIHWQGQHLDQEPGVSNFIYQPWDKEPYRIDLLNNMNPGSCIEEEFSLSYLEKSLLYLGINRNGLNAKTFAHGIETVLLRYAIVSDDFLYTISEIFGMTKFTGVDNVLNIEWVGRDAKGKTQIIVQESMSPEDFPPNVHNNEGGFRKWLFAHAKMIAEDYGVQLLISKKQRMK
jgi:hypothetical protein